MSRIAPGRLVEAGAALDPHRLGDRDLDVVDELPVPDRLEDAVREPQRQHVLHRLLAEVVVDPEDLVLPEPAVQQLVELARRREVVAERLLDDQPHPALLRPPLADLGHRGRERLRRHGEVVEAVAAGAALGVELLEHLPDAILALLVVELGADVAHPRGEPVPDVLPERIARELLHRLLHRGGELLRRLRRARDADDRELLRQQLAVGERVERGDQLALRQVARGTEDHDGARLGAPPQLQPFEQRVRRPRVTPPPASPTLARMPSSSSANESANFCTPSASSVATTSS